MCQCMAVHDKVMADIIILCQDIFVYHDMVMVDVIVSCQDTGIS